MPAGGRTIGAVLVLLTAASLVSCSEERGGERVVPTSTVSAAAPAVTESATTAAPTSVVTTVAPTTTTTTVAPTTTTTTTTTT
nr:hypothetical protein [Acidimicrobiales bacterium]